MRRLTPLLLLLGLSLTACSGFGEFLDHAFTLPGEHPNVPMADGENVRRALGIPTDVQPLQLEPGNVWPRFDTHEPTLSDLENNPGREDRGEQPALPDHRQPRPVRGSSTPPGNVPPGPGPIPTPNAPPPPPVGPTSRLPGGVVNTPEGPAIDSGGTNAYRQLNTPRGPGAIIVPNGNGTSTIIHPDGTVETVPTPR